MIRKSMPSGHDPRVETGFPKRSCSNKKIERDDDSKKSHLAPASDPLLPQRPKPEAEEERHRRSVRIGPIVIRSVVVMRPVIRTIGITPGVPNATPRAEVGCLRCVSCVQACCVQAYRV